MKSINLELDKSKKYVVACSFGPDSMALLDLCLKNKLKIVVAHVNYHKRDVSNFEEQSLREFCNKNHIEIEVLDTTNLEHSGNFQEWARETRYKFFKKVAEKYSCFGVLVAHQEDDVIETYLMQKKRGNVVKYWGITVENDIFGMKVIRPLLGYSKQELLDYDIANKIPYSIDESNLTDNYTRNKVRHHDVKLLSEVERKNIINFIKNQQQNSYKIDTEFDSIEFITFSDENLVYLLDYFMEKVCEHRDLSHKFLTQIKKAIESKSTFSIQITNSILLESNYGVVNIINSKKLESYCYKFSQKLETDLLKIDFSQGAEDRNIYDTKNLLVRNLKLNDEIKINNYTCKARRLFIDWKVPKYLRKIWPCICGQDGTILYVPRYRKNFKDEHKSKMEIKLQNLRVFDL